MNDKRRVILESALHLFAMNGFHLTSMQEIAMHSGVAKGSLYTYFSSKEDLLLSILKHYNELFSYKLEQLEKETELSEKQRLKEQISIQLKEFTSHKDFILMYMREPIFHKNEEINDFMLRMRKDSMDWYHEKIITVYGETVRPYAFDSAILFSGMLREYLIMAILDGCSFNCDQLAIYLVERLDDIMEGIKASSKVMFRNI